MSGTIPTGGEISSSLVRDHLYTFDKECFIDKLSTTSQNGCSAAYSTRLLRSSYFGPMVRVRRGSDNVEQDFYGDVFGKLGTRIYATGTSLTSWLGGAVGYVRMIYDQSGNVRNIGQATNANQPTITSSAITYSGSQWLDLTNTQVPSVAMTSNSSGGLVASASSELGTGWLAWNAFDLNSATGWHNSTASYVVGTGIYTGAFTTTDINGVVHRGEWLQIQLASSIKLNAFSITPRPTNATERSPRDFVILGSNNGTTWTVVHQEFNINNWTTAARTFTVTTSNVQSYSYYRIVTKRIGNSDSGMATSDTVQIMEWALNPTTVPLAAGNDTYTYYATWTPTSNATSNVICEQNTSSLIGSRRAALLCIAGGLRYGFNGEANDIHNLVSFSLNIKRRTVMMCNHTLTSGNVEIYDEGILYRGTSGVPGNLNIGGDIFIIGRKSNGTEYMTGDINEVIVTNNTALEREAVLYFSPPLLTKPRDVFPKPKKQLTFYPVTDNATPINHSAIAIADLNLDLINVSNGIAVSDWNGYTQGTAANRPVYYNRGGYTNEMGYINFDRANSQHLTSSRTLNIATNGGITVVALVKFTGTAGSWERIIDFGSGAGVNNIGFARFETSNQIRIFFYNGSTEITQFGAAAIVQNEWAVFSFRYTHSNRVTEIFKNNVLIASQTIPTQLTDRTLSNCFIGRSHFSDAYLNGQIGGLYIFDRSLTYNEMTTLANALTVYATPNIPRHISDISMVNTENMILSVPARDGWAGTFNGLSGNYIDMMDVPNVPMTYCFWFYQTSSTYSTIVGLTDYSRNGNGIQIDYPTATNQLTVFSALPTPWSRIDIANIFINTWYHIAITVNTNFQVQVYLNGVYQNQVTGTAIPPNRSRFIIGASGDGGRGYTGLIHDFRVYDYIVRGEEIARIYSKSGMSQNSLQAPSSYLVNVRNWYSIMQLGKAGGTFTGAYVAQSSGSDPDVQYQLVNSTASVQNYMYHNQRIQDYRSFTCSYEIFISNLGGSDGGGDQMYFFVGSTALPTWKANYNNSNYIDFEVYRLSGAANRGVAFIRNGVNVSQSHYTQYIDVGNWVPVSITYQRNRNDATWVVNVAGNELINYTDTDNESWRNSSGSYWGIGAWTGGAVMSAYIRRVELTYVPDASSRLVKGFMQNTLKRYPEIALNANSSFNCVASASSEIVTEPAWNAFDFESNNTIWTTFDQYYSSGNYIRNPPTTTTIDGVSYSGEWLQIQLPRAIVLSKYNILGRWNEIARSPKLFYLAGSNDGTTWTMLDSRTNITGWLVGLPFEFTPFKGGSYRYFRLIINQNNGGTWLSIQQFELYSYPFNGVKYPIGPMTSDVTTFGGNGVGCGTYRTTYSSTWSTNEFLGWKAFTNEAGGGYEFFHVVNNSSGTGFYSGSNGSYIGSVSTTISGSAYLGEWLQLELPTPIRLTRYGILSRNGLPNQAPKTWKIAGSNDASTWTEVDTETNITGWSDDVVKTFTTSNSTIPYKYYRMVTNQIADAGGAHWSQREWMLYDDTNSYIYGKAPGLVEGLTWKWYGSDLGGNPSSFNMSMYNNIGRTTSIRNLSFGTSGQQRVNGADNHSIEWTGYFRANATGTHTFYIASDDWSYIWIGQNALAGYTTTNATINNGGYKPVTEASSSIYLVEGVYYPIRMQYGEGGGGDDCQVSFLPPGGTLTYDGTGYYFSSIGTNQAYPAESAKIIKEISDINTDGVYYININGISTATYCLMNDIYDGGGWMMLMKATRGTTFNYNSEYWTRINTLNSTDTTRSDADAKFNTYNYTPIKDVMVIWPDISPTAYTNVYGKNGGSLLIPDGWVWKIDNWNGYSYLIQQLTTTAQNSLRGAYALYKANRNYIGPTVRLRRYGDNAEQDFFANLAGNLGTTLDATGTAVMSWIGGMPLNIINSNNWYSLMTRSGTAQAVSGTDPFVQSQLATGVESQSGVWSYSSVPISTYSNLFFETQVYWQAAPGWTAGDFYTFGFGDTTANGGQGVRIYFNFWDGFSNNGFSGVGIYLMKNGVAVAKSNTTPYGSGANTWFSVQVIYNKSTTNTWQVNINGVSGLTYNDPNALTWAASAGNFFAITAHSGGGLRMNCWYRQLNMCANFAYVTNWYDQSNNGFHATQTTAANQPILTADSSGKFIIDSQNTGTQFLQMGTTGPIPTGSSNFTLLLRHGSVNTNVGAFISAGSWNNNNSNVIRGGGPESVGYWHYWFNNDLAFGTNARPTGNTVALTWDGTTRRGYVVGNGGREMLSTSNTNIPTAPNVATAQQYLFRAPGGEYLNGQLYHAFVFNTALSTGDLSVLTNSQNYSTTAYASNVSIPQKITALEGLQLSRDAHPGNPYVFNGFSSTLFSTQAGAARHVIGGGGHLSAVWKVRWGLLFNNEADFLSIDNFSGIGMDAGYQNASYSAGDSYYTVGTSNLNRSARMEFYGR